MKKLLTLALFLPFCTSAQKISITAYGSYGFGAKYPDYPIYEITEQSHFGGGLKLDASFLFLQAGIGGEYSAYHGKGKVIKDYNTKIPYTMSYGYPRESFKGSELYAGGKCAIPYLFVNAGKKMLHNRLRVYGGIIAGVAFPDYTSTYAVYNYTDYLAYTPGSLIRIYTQTKEKGLMYGLQLGATAKLASKLSFTLSADARRVSYKSMSTFNTEPRVFNYVNIYYGDEIKYAFTYFPVSIGLRYIL